ncbi:M48 family metallopeptidase [Alkalimarinus sediminis]|uniref:M48 family metallopeptidase n=1 Tax=Alkalimarinus sediminis TaxID=1632866 RepID=A0A9E8HT93_9ALTE|nr:M48 family metallopeptidase [Alkalimarinus sediminis]UZW76106.1 M48 family metallopeptidase [Alkalimarinus sediminis]
MSKALKYLSGYPESIVSQALRLVDEDKLGGFLLKRYPVTHDVGTDRALYNYVVDIKNNYIKKSQPLSKVVFDDKINVINHALGLHTYISRVQGGKLKAKNEIRIASVFKNTPVEFLRMISVHELAHLKEKDHNKAFYSLCRHMEPDYHQLELDMRLYLTHLDLVGELY